jgi:predicted patatin/cPLA2 family phospholipase
MEAPKRNIVLYLSAGAMSGVFSSGFTKVFEEAGLKQYIHSVYGNSAGSFAGLYFLSGQVDLAAKLYWEDLDGEKYIKWSRLPVYTLRAFCNKLFWTKLKLLPVFDIDYIAGILTTRRKWDFAAFKQSGIDLYMIAYNLTTHHHDYLKVEKEEDIIPYLRATAGGHPAYPHSSLIHGNLYVDGGTIDDERRIARIIERHPDKEIVCVLNNPEWAGSRISNFFSKMGIALVMLPFFGIREAINTARSDFSNVDIERMRSAHPYLHFVANDLIGYQMSTDAAKLEMLYKRGQELAREFLLSGELKSVPYPLPVEWARTKPVTAKEAV